MGQIVLSEVGAAIGRRALPQGVSILGRKIAGATIGRAIGNYAGRALDGLLAPAAEGPRLKELHVMEAREGAGIPSLYGRMRVGGQVIWAARFTETRTTRKVSSKGGPKIREYDYSVSFAVALCEGVITNVERVWANGEPFDLSDVTHRIYKGYEAQLPDPLIEAIEGAGCAPAYRGTAYIVFEDLPLEAFGNRLPQLSFEIVRVPPATGNGAGLNESVSGVNIIPASGEFVYATDIVRERSFPGVERALNAFSGERRADFPVSLDQMQAELPRVDKAALTVAWFGDDLRAGSCRIRPGVETKERMTVPFAWSVAGVERGDAYRVSYTNGSANYGGTPADKAVIQGIQELKARGVAVTLSPFLLMDIPSGNGLPDPYGGAEQAAFPWRGRMTVAADGTAAARTEIETFLNGAWGYRAFILHHAQLAADAGGVEAFLIGSEMRGLTRIRDQNGAFPFIEGLQALAAEVKLVLPGANISYAADWTEYGAYVPGDGSNDVLFPLDALWADPAIDFVGIDWYPPMGDWRDGAAHLDAQAGYSGADDLAYLQAQIEGGEAYDWYYASEADRAAQNRTPISDTAFGEDWVFRQKDLAGWHGAVHYERPGGVRAQAPTAWTPGMKPVRLSEIGFPAVDKGTNSPNLFIDPKSSESFLPPYSNGARDDVLQRAALGVALPAYDNSGVVESAYVWAWDGRPFPAFPVREEIWSDGPNWRVGHWLNGRSGLAPLRDVVADICVRGGIGAFDTSGLNGAVEGYALDGVSGVSGALEPLRAAFGFEVVERAGVLVFQMSDEGALTDLSAGELAGDGISITRGLLDKAPGLLRLSFADIDNDYQPGIAEARIVGADARLSVDIALPIAMGAGRAGQVAARLLNEAAGMDSAEIALPLAGLAIEPGDRLRIDDGPVWSVKGSEHSGARVALALAPDIAALAPVRAIEPGAPRPILPVAGEIDLIVIDGPVLPGGAGEALPLVAAFADPWPGAVRVKAGADAAGLSERALLQLPAVTGRLEASVAAGPLGRWDYANAISVRAPAGGLASAAKAAILNGANAALLETDAGWELIQFQMAELVSEDAYRLSGLLRGLQGSSIGAAAAGARFVLLDEAVVPAQLQPGEIGLDLVWQADGNTGSETVAYQARSGLPWRVGHLRAQAVSGGGWSVSWTRRGADIAQSWALPEAVNTGRFRVEIDTGAGFGAAAETLSAYAAVGADALAVRVAETGPDGRVGEWVSLELAAA